MTKPIATVSRTRQIMDKHRLSFKKSLGQNFIIDVNILKKIIKKAEVDEETIVIEIGPGIGALTEQLAQTAKHVYAFEIDQRFIGVLQQELNPYENITIFNEDILEANLDALIQDVEGEKIKVVSNLPYYVTTPILMKLLTDELPISSYTVMMQKEVAERMAAKPSTKEYGSLSIAVQFYTTSEIVMSVSPSCFMPQPNVESAILKLTKREQPIVDVLDRALFFEIVKASFEQRRKTIKNNLGRHFKERLGKDELEVIFQKSSIDPTRRGESLSIKEFASLANTFYHHLTRY